MTAHDDWVDRARASSLADAAQLLGLKVPRRGELQGPCPACGGADRFSVNLAKGAWNCRGAHGGHDAIGLVMHARGVDFLAAVEMLTGEAPPRGETHVRERDPAVEKERQEERRDDEIARAKAEDAAFLEAVQKATALFESGVPIEGTLALDYLEDWRGLDLRMFSTTNLRFRNDLEYWGLPAPDAVDADGAPLDPEKKIKLGSFPCLLAAMRELDGRIHGVKRTYLDRSGRKLTPPGSRENTAKLGTYRMGGGLIYLDDTIGDTLAIGEGLETTASWRCLSRDIGLFGDLAASASIACADSLSNMARHDLALPPQVRRLILLGDGDSNPATTRQALIGAAQAHRERGLEVQIHMAPTVEPHARDWKQRGMDWGDVPAALRQRERIAA